MAGDEASDARAEQCTHRVGSDARVPIGSVGYDDGADVVHESRHLQLDVVGSDLAETLPALQRVGEQVDVFFVGVHGTSREQIEERADALDRLDRFDHAHSIGSGAGGR